MADLKTLGVMRYASASYLILLAAIISSVLAQICPDKQYYNATEQRCTNCSECSQGDVVLRPCELFSDTVCGPISALSELFVSANHHRHHHERHRHERHRKVGNGDNENSAETLVWDWQAIALTSAVFACILFFLVVTLYSLHQARQWRRLKENFEADVEELSTRLSLMAATSEKCELLEGQNGTGFGGTTPPADPSYLSSRCVYLEQLLSVRKEDEKNSNNKSKGNVYIEENKTKK
ncbi:tumor necrosis factor receptor superfamily member wengen isoform X2 [Rhynchophorus ferrugineus]|uniref:tumor necrosis factor receptor superfamily member wengen isoform X2 n=1 Tax=Rhynchophorus ferrugineus TaxID=354439 RepID=UPI003FCE8DC3